MSYFNSSGPIKWSYGWDYIEKIIVFLDQTCTPIIFWRLGLPWLQQPSHFQGIILVGDTSTFWSIILVGDISAFRSIILVWDTLAFLGIILAGDISAFLLVRLLGQCLSNGRNDVLIGVPYASSYEFTEFLLLLSLKFTNLEPFRFLCVPLILLLSTAKGIALPCINH